MGGFHMAISTTKAVTYARFDLLKMQIMDFFRRASNPSSGSIQKISKALDNKYIKRISVEGLLNGKKAAEIKMDIDWRLHSISVQTGGEKIQAPDYWNNGINPTIDEALSFFNSICNREGLKRDWRVTYVSGFDEEKLDNELGLVDASDTPWITKPVSTGRIRFDPLDELGLETLIDESLADKR